MKKISKVLMLVCIAVLLFACGVKLSNNFFVPKYSDAELVAFKYLTFLMKKDWENAKKIATPETAQNLDMMNSLGADFGLTEVKDVKCAVTNDEATCTFCCTKDTSFKELKMKKIDGKWYVHQPKETPPTEEPGSAEEQQRNREKH